MDAPTTDRRSCRSENLALALRYLLASHRERAGLTHVALASMDGMLLAWDGDHAECEEIAAYAPFIARGEGYVLDGRRLAGITVHTLHSGRDELVLAMRGEATPEAVGTFLLAGVEGVIRILAR